MLAVVDGRAILAYVKSGTPGSAGDSTALATSRLSRKIESGEWMSCTPRPISGQLVHPYLVADAAFALSQSMMKCYAETTTPFQESFNFAGIRTRRVIEQAFGCLKARFSIVLKRHLKTQNPLQLCQDFSAYGTTFVSGGSAPLKSLGV